MKYLGFIVLLVLMTVGISVVKSPVKGGTQAPNANQNGVQSPQPTKPPADPLSIEGMKQRSYPGSSITLVRKLSDGQNYKRSIVSYTSDGLTIYGLLTVPKQDKPVGGWPVIILNHGYIPPAQYATEASYVGVVEPLARAGFIVFKPDYRGNGDSEGKPVQPYIDPGYVTDSMNAIASIKNYPEANPQKIGVIGHSMGGNITLHELVISKDIKAAVIVAGVVGNESQLITWWNKRLAEKSIIGNDLDTDTVIEQMVKEHGNPTTNQTYWKSIDPNAYLSDVSVPVQILVGSEDRVVPVEFSESLRDRLKAAGKEVTFTMYEGADHNLMPNLSEGLGSAVSFFNAHLR